MKTQKPKKQPRKVEQQVKPATNEADELDRQKNWDEVSNARDTLTRTQLSDAVKKIVDTVNYYFARSKGFDFLVDAEGGGDGNCELPTKWLERLDPGITILENHIDRRLDNLDALVKDEVTAKAASLCIDDDICHLKSSMSREYFRLGILVGAKMQGATDGELEELGETWVRRRYGE